MCQSSLQTSDAETRSITPISTSCPVGFTPIGSGLALTCLKHSLPGDFSLFSVRDIEAFMAGGLDVRR